MSTAQQLGSGRIISRPRLEARLDESFARRVTTLVAGPGFGKSTLLSSWARDVEHVHLSLTAADAHVDRLVRELSAALADLLSGKAASAAMRAAAASGDASRAELAAGILAQALDERLRHDVVLVLDDVHEVPVGSQAARLLEALCRHAPGTLHVVIASRTAPPIRLERLRGRGDVLELWSADLAFSEAEVDELVGLRLGDGHTDVAARLYEASGGWPAAVALALDALGRAPSHAALLAELDRVARGEGPLDAYLAGEVFAGGHGQRRLLQHAALFDRVTADLCEALGSPAAAPALEDLVQRGFAERHDRESFSLHGLVREFVTRAWPLPADEVSTQRVRAAAWFEREGVFDAALAQLAAAEATWELVRVLRDRGDEALAQAGPAALIRLQEQVSGVEPGEAVEQLLGEAHMLRGEFTEALECFKRAAAGRDRTSAALGWRLVAAYHLQGRLAEAVSAAADATERGAPPADLALLHGWLASAERRLGREDDASRHAEQAVEEARTSRDGRALALAYTSLALLEAPPHGDMRLSVALRAAKKVGDTFLEARIHNNRGSRLLERGAYAEAIEELGLAIQLADVGGYGSLVALATMNRGLCHWCRGRLEEASADYESALVVYRSIGSSEAAYALIGKGDVHRERGELAQARAAYEEGLAIGEETNDRQALVPALYQLAKVIVDEEPRRAERLARRAVGYGWPDLPWALNALGWVLLTRGDRDGAADAAAAAAQAAGELEDPFGIAESLELSSLTVDAPERRVELLEEALAIWRRLDNVVHVAAVELALARLGSGAARRRAATRAERRLQAFGVRVRPTGAAGLVRFVAQPVATPLAIEALGGFRVLETGRPIPRSAWRSKKARDLLQILVSRRGCRVPRESLMETLWPEHDPARLPHRLSVAISALRGVLDPARRFPPEHFVSGDRDAVALNLDTVAVDVHDFLEEAQAGLLAWRGGGAEEARELLHSAEALYRGDFLDEIYEDWAVSRREEARAAYLDVVRALAEDAIAGGDHDHAGRLLLRLLERDPFDERAHLGLVSVRIEAGRHGDAQRAYRTYCARMEQIAVEAAPYPRAAV